MIFDRPEHREWLLELLNSEQISVPLKDVELLAELKLAVRAAEVGPELKLTVREAYDSATIQNGDNFEVVRRPDEATPLPFPSSLRESRPRIRPL